MSKGIHFQKKLKKVDLLEQVVKLKRSEIESFFNKSWDFWSFLFKWKMQPRVKKLLSNDNLVVKAPKCQILIAPDFTMGYIKKYYTFWDKSIHVCWLFKFKCCDLNITIPLFKSLYFSAQRLLWVVSIDLFCPFFIPFLYNGV